jgi:hypothetical protein
MAWLSLHWAINGMPSLNASLTGAGLTEVIEQDVAVGPGEAGAEA